jgi:hypothetical protein
MNIFRTLAEVIYDKNFFKIEEMESIIETYFKIYLSDANSNEFVEDALSRERIRIISEKNQLGIKRDVIEVQIFEAKTKIAEGNGHEVDRHWFNRLNAAFKFTKQEIRSCDERLTILAMAQKESNIKKANTEDRIVLDGIKAIIENRFGREYLLDLYNEVNRNIQIEEKTLPS